MALITLATLATLTTVPSSPLPPLPPPLELAILTIHGALAIRHQQTAPSRATSYYVLHH